MHLLQSLVVLQALSLAVSAAEPRIHNDYATAYRDAQAQDKLLLIQFQTSGAPLAWPPQAQSLLRSYVRADLSLAAMVEVDNEPQRLLDMPAFALLGHAPGLAIINLKDHNQSYGDVLATLAWGQPGPSAAQLSGFLKAPLDELGPQIHVDQFGLTWLFDYDTAYARAEKEKKLLLLAFDAENSRFAPDRATAAKMRELILVRLRVEDSDELLSQEGFRQFHFAAGVGIVDLKHTDEDHGRLVQTLPEIYLTMAGTRAMIAVAKRETKLPPLVWQTDYHAARAQAVAEKKMLLVAVDSKDQVFTPRTPSLPLLCGYVLLRQTTETKYVVDGDSWRLLECGDFLPLRDQPGVVIYDLKHEGQPHYGEVVSVMPYQYLASDSDNRVFDSEERERQLLSLEPSTLTRRTLTWAIRVSKGAGEQQRLRSADGRPCEILMDGASRNSHLQCRSGCGHFAGGLSGPEIASPGSGRDIVDGALNMVRIWCSSSPHYRVMVRYHPQFGYDMVASNSNHWYGTGRF